jgi:serine-type D-Ala-D-Ala carboxypeptidase (penicillin-binding protein 5/6)
VSLPVLHPVRRRKRRRSRRSRALLLALVAGLGIAAAVWLSGRGSSRAADPPAAVAREATSAPATKSAAPPVAAAAAPPLVVGPPRLTGALHPLLGARAAIVIDAADGRIVYALRAHRRLPIASTTKIMTAHLVLQHRPLGSVVRIDWTVPRVPLIREGLRAGERVPTWKLMYGMLLFSGNDDALALAIATAGSRPAFLRLMNREAARLRLRDTHFTSPSGVIDEGNYSTASDLAALTRVALRDPRFREVVRTRIKRVTWPAPTYSKVYVNKNRLLELYPHAIGVKTGFTTKAGRCLVGAATRHGRTLIAVVLHSDRPYNDVARLLNIGYRTAA